VAKRLFRSISGTIITTSIDSHYSRTCTAPFPHCPLSSSPHLNSDSAPKNLIYKEINLSKKRLNNRTQPYYLIPKLPSANNPPANNRMAFWTVSIMPNKNTHHGTKIPIPTKAKVLVLNYWWILVTWRFGGKKTFPFNLWNHYYHIY
jgi:hypothetical protein